MQFGKLPRMCTRISDGKGTEKGMFCPGQGAFILKFHCSLSAYGVIVVLQMRLYVYMYAELLMQPNTCTRVN